MIFWIALKGIKVLLMKSNFQKLLSKEYTIDDDIRSIWKTIKIDNRFLKRYFR